MTRGWTGRPGRATKLQHFATICGGRATRSLTRPFRERYPYGTETGPSLLRKAFRLQRKLHANRTGRQCPAHAKSGEARIFSLQGLGHDFEMERLEALSASRQR